MDYLIALGLTMLMEVPVYWLGLHYALGRPAALSLILALAVNFATHPAVYVGVYPALATVAEPIVAVSAAETLVMLVEWGVLARWSGTRSDGLLVLSLVSNSLSFLLGRIILG